MTAGRLSAWESLPLRAAMAVSAAVASLVAMLLAARAIEGGTSAVPVHGRVVASSTWPDGTTTGVPRGTDLTTTGALRITEPGTTIDATLILGSVEILASDVTIRRSRIIGGTIQVGDDTHRPSGVLIEDVEIDGRGIPVERLARMPGIGYGGFTVRRAHIHHVGMGVSASFDTVVEDSWISSLVVDGDPAAGGSHNDGILSNGGSGLRFVGNRIELGTEPNISGAICLFGDFEPVRDVVVAGNLLSGGGYGLYAGSVAGKPFPRASDVRVLDNTFGPSVYGPMSGWQPGRGNRWLGNSEASSGEVVLP